MILLKKVPLLVSIYFSLIVASFAGDGTSGGLFSRNCLNLTDGSNTVNCAQKLTVTGGTVGGSNPNATLSITGGSGGGTPGGAQGNIQFLDVNGTLKSFAGNAGLYYSGTASTVGNVGIGSINPGQLLDVQGTIRAVDIINNGDIRRYGARCNGKTITDGVATAASTTFTSATANFTSADVGKLIILYEVGSAASLPTGVAVTIAGAPGATSYSYKVTAITKGGETTASSAGSTTTGNATLDFSNYNNIAWVWNGYSTGYNIYRTAGGATQGLIGTVSSQVSQFNDTGFTAGAAAPVSNTAYNVVTTTISSVTNATTIVLGIAATNNNGAVTFTYGTDDGAAINSAFAANAGTGISITGPVNSTTFSSIPLLVYSKTKIVFPKSLTIISTDATHDMLYNYNATPLYNNTVGNTQRIISDGVVTANQYLLTSATANFTNADVNRSVVIPGSVSGNSQMYAGIIIAVSSSTVAVLNNIIPQSGSSLTVNFYNRDSDIELSGGNWIKSQTTNTSALPWDFSNIDNIYIHDLQWLNGALYENVAGYGCRMTNDRNLHEENINLVASGYHTDGLHIEGPMDGFFISNITGATQDDLIPLVGSSNPPGSYQDTMGPISNGTINHLYANSNTSLINFDSRRIYNITVNDVDGGLLSPITSTFHSLNTDATTVLNNVVFNNCKITYIPMNSSSTYISDIHFNNLFILDKNLTSANSIVSFSGNWNNITFNGLHDSSNSYSTASIIQLTGTIASLTVDNATINRYGQGAWLIENGTSLGSLQLSNIWGSGLNGVVISKTGATWSVLQAKNIYLTATNGFVLTKTSVDMSVDNFYGSLNFWGIQGFTTGIVVTLRGSGATMNRRGWDDNGGSGAKIKLLNRDWNIQSTYNATPTVTSCGTAPTISSNSSDLQGTVTMGQAGTGCTVTLSNPYTNTPYCEITGQSIPYGLTTSNSAFSFTGTPGNYSYACFPYNE